MAWDISQLERAHVPVYVFLFEGEASYGRPFPPSGDEGVGAHPVGGRQNLILCQISLTIIQFTVLH
jgi:hypothetical protein